jgi:hypothetical protein
MASHRAIVSFVKPYARRAAISVWRRVRVLLAMAILIPCSLMSHDRTGSEACHEQMFIDARTCSAELAVNLPRNSTDGRPPDDGRGPT